MAKKKAETGLSFDPDPAPVGGYVALAGHLEPFGATEIVVEVIYPTKIVTYEPGGGHNERDLSLRFPVIEEGEVLVRVFDSGLPLGSPDAAPAATPREGWKLIGSGRFEAVAA